VQANTDKIVAADRKHNVADEVVACLISLLVQHFQTSLYYKQLAIMVFRVSCYLTSLSTVFAYDVAEKGVFDSISNFEFVVGAAVSVLTGYLIVRDSLTARSFEELWYGMLQSGTAAVVHLLYQCSREQGAIGLLRQAATAFAAPIMGNCARLAELRKVCNQTSSAHLSSARNLRHECVLAFFISMGCGLTFSAWLLSNQLVQVGIILITLLACVSLLAIRGPDDGPLSTCASRYVLPLVYLRAFGVGLEAFVACQACHQPVSELVAAMSGGHAMEPATSVTAIEGLVKALEPAIHCLVILAVAQWLQAGLGLWAALRRAEMGIALNALACAVTLHLATGGVASSFPRGASSLLSTVMGLSGDLATIGMLVSRDHRKFVWQLAGPYMQARYFKLVGFMSTAWQCTRGASLSNSRSVLHEGQRSDADAEVRVPEAITEVACASCDQQVACSSCEEQVEPTLNKDKPRSNECPICLEDMGGVRTAFVPCGHIVCSACSEKCTNCYFCQVKVQSKLRVFLM